MSTELMIGLTVVGLVVLSYIIRYVVRTVFNKAGDAIQNKIADKKNADSGNREENLSDRIGTKNKM